MRDVSEAHKRLFREGNSDTKFGASRTKFWRETEMAGIAKSKIANVHVEALRRGAFLREHDDRTKHNNQIDHRRGGGKTVVMAVTMMMTTTMTMKPRSDHGCSGGK